MNGDLVMYGGQLCRLVISSNGAHVERLSDGNQIPPCVDVDPIQLTEEILTINGWKWRRKGCTQSMRLFDKEGHSILTLTYGKLILIGGREVKVNYVHQLQHALRLCGLNDNANNFKV